MRLVFLPLTRRPASLIATASRTPSIDEFKLITFWSQRVTPLSEDNEQTYVSRAINKAASTWEGFGKAKEGNWKKRIHKAGEKLLDKIEFEEWALKSVVREAIATKPISCLYPPSATSEKELREYLTRFVEIRQPYHRRYAIYSAIWVPICAPIAIIPVVPNFPAFYAIFRGYSHWRAMKAAEFLSDLLKNNRLTFEPSMEVDAEYTKAGHVMSSESEDVLVADDSVDRIANIFHEPALQLELRRARIQTLERIKARLKKDQAETGKVENDIKAKEH